MSYPILFNYPIATKLFQCNLSEPYLAVETRKTTFLNFNNKMDINRMDINISNDIEKMDFNRTFNIPFVTSLIERDAFMFKCICHNKEIITEKIQLANLNTELICYSDGSKKNDGFSGAGIITNGFDIKTIVSDYRRLRAHKDSNIAEAVIIYSILSSANTSVTIISDSEIILKRIFNKINNINININTEISEDIQKIIEKIYLNIVNGNREVVFIHTLAHKEKCLGNKIVDIIAKYAGDILYPIKKVHNIFSINHPLIQTIIDLICLESDLDERALASKVLYIIIQYYDTHPQETC